MTRADVLRSVDGNGPPEAEGDVTNDDNGDEQGKSEGPVKANVNGQKDRWVQRTVRKPLLTHFVTATATLLSIKETTKRRTSKCLALVMR